MMGVSVWRSAGQLAGAFISLFESMPTCYDACGLSFFVEV